MDSTFGLIKGMLKPHFDVLIRALEAAQCLAFKDIMVLRHREIAEGQ